jgi:putative sugar O-methyltransferase
MTLGDPSTFWKRLGTEHQQDLQTFGFEHFKRHQAFRYFTWRWKLAAIHRSEQLRFLLNNTSPLTWVRCAPGIKDVRRRGWRGISWAWHERWLYTFATRLLWEYVRRRDTLGVLKYEEPTLGHPPPVYWRGRLVSQDLANSALEVRAIHHALRGRAPENIVEVGAGYGRTAYALLKLYPSATYTVVDIEPALDISRWYLSRLFPAERLRFIHPEEATELPAGWASLGVSISSLQEMTPAQIAGYLSMFDRVADGGVVYLKQWQHWYNPDDQVTFRFDECPIPSRWQLLYKKPAPVQTAFQEAAWHLP